LQIVRTSASLAASEKAGGREQRGTNARTKERNGNTKELMNQGTEERKQARKKTEVRKLLMKEGTELHKKERKHENPA